VNRRISLIQRIQFESVGREFLVAMVACRSRPRIFGVLDGSHSTQRVVVPGRLGDLGIAAVGFSCDDLRLLRLLSTADERR
jgi:hypothetical protein